MSLLKIVTLKKKEIIILHVANFAFPTSLLFIVREVLIFSHLFLDHLELNSNKFVNVKKKNLSSDWLKNEYMRSFWSIR